MNFLELILSGFRIIFFRMILQRKFSISLINFYYRSIFV
ncbi:MAG: hypothetical protein MRERV_35c006 [Mycoplasmataceae bacterium RV_VA103A]|nr:MAG: hypothetical protein MRERV_35c006 [Mycoplasmataceae bacterium RV_VA103A]